MEDYARGGYVNYDCRSGDMITVGGFNYRVINTFPLAIHADRDGSVSMFKYDELRENKAYYAARCIPTCPPEGETKL